MNKIIHKILNHPRAVIAAIIILTIPFAYFYANQKFFNHIDIYFEKNDPDLVRYKEFQQKYGNEEIAVIAFEEPDIFTDENITLIRNISDMAKKNLGIQRVLSITEAEEAVGTEETVSFRKIIPPGSITEPDLKKYRQKFLNHPNWVKNIISEDGRAAAIIIELEVFEDNVKKRDVILNIKKSARQIADGRVKLYFSGAPFVEVELNRLSINDTLTFAPIVLFVILIIITFILKNYIISLLCLANLGLTVIWAIGFFTMTGEKLNMVIVIIPPVLLAIAVADAIHLLTHYREAHINYGYDHNAAVANAVKSVWLPCLFTSLTTGIGFFSFITSSVRPVKIVGIYTLVGVMIAFLLTITMLPASLVLMKKRLDLKDKKQKVRKPEQDTADTVLSRILTAASTFSTRWNKAISVSIILFIVITILGMSQLKFETNFSNYLPDKSELKKDAEFFKKHLGGIIPIEFLIKADSNSRDFSNPGSLTVINDIQKELPLVTRTFSSSYSIVDYLKEMHRAFNEGKDEYYRIPDKREDIVFYTETGDPEILDRVISLNRSEARISFRSYWISNEYAKRMMIDIRTYMDKKLKGAYTYVRTGLATLYVKMGDNLKQSQIRSFMVAFTIIFVMMIFVCRNTALTLISMVPNIFPIFMTLALMGWIGIPLDVSTIMIASVTLGIAVDDTIHFIVWFRRNVNSGMDVENSIKKTFSDVGKPIVITSVVLFIGFFVLILGNIKPTRSFGVLTAFSMIFALVGDLILLPALLMVFKKFIKAKPAAKQMEDA